MNNMDEFLYWVLACGFVTGMIGLRCIDLFKLYLASWKRRGMFPELVKSRDERLCKGQHSWHKSKLVFKALEVREHLVCISCGQVSGTEFMLNSPGLEVMRNNTRLAEEDQVARKKFKEVKQQKLQVALNRLQKRFYKTQIGYLADLEAFFWAAALEYEIAADEAFDEVHPPKNG